MSTQLSQSTVPLGTERAPLACVLFVRCPVETLDRRGCCCAWRCVCEGRTCGRSTAHQRKGKGRHTYTITM
jgi:hypothetical protein